MRSLDQFINLIDNGIKIKLNAGDFNSNELKQLSDNIISNDKLLLELDLIHLPYIEMVEIIELFKNKNVCLKITPMDSISSFELIELKNQNITFDFTMVINNNE